MSLPVTSPDPAVRGDRWDRYVAWCDRDNLDPFDDANLERFDIECDQALADAAAERHEAEVFEEDYQWV